MNAKLARNQVIAAAGRSETQRRQTKSVTSLQSAMKKITKEIAGNEGIYPLNEGKLNTQEVLRRAGKSPSYLEKKTPKIVALKKTVTDWLEHANKKIKQGAPTIRRAVNERVVEAKDELNEIRQAWAEAELEHADTLAKLTTALATIKALEKRNADLQVLLAGAKVVRFPETPK